MFGRAYEYGRLSPEKKIMRVIRVKGERDFGILTRGKKKG
jgi:hypothetical protein